MTSPVLQLRVPEDTLNHIDAIRGDDTRFAWLQHLIDRELVGEASGTAVIHSSCAPPYQP